VRPVGPLTMDVWWSILGVVAAAAVSVVPTMLLALVVFDGTVLGWWEREELPGFRLVFRSPEATVNTFGYVATDSPARRQP
jgi:hypothetical protein